MRLILSALAAAAATLSPCASAKAQAPAVFREAAVHMLAQSAEGPPTAQRMRLLLTADRPAEAEEQDFGSG